jgi:hypothetical protein
MKEAMAPCRLRRVEAHAVDQQHDAFLLQAANDRVLALRAVAGHGQAGFAAQRFAGIGGAAPQQLGAVERRRRNGVSRSSAA